jgi:GntR family transcriptional repressor for pyruvate dehydrogenase complex
VVGPVRRPSLTPASRAVKLIAPIKKTRIPETIADRIRQLILDRAFQPGRPLPSERVLARRFAVSRGSIRDALRMLETVGLLEARHGQGTFPRELSVDRLVIPIASVITFQRDLQEELMDVRRMFEPAVARAAAARVTDDDLAELERVLAAQRRKLKTGQSAIAEDTAFHAVLARATRNRVAVRIMETLNDLLIESRKLTLRQKGRPQRSLSGHQAIVAALRRRNPDAAARAMHAHIDQIGELLKADHGNGSRGHRRLPSPPR